VNEETRKQANREAVARETIALLGTAEPPQGSAAGETIDEEWLNSFEKFVEDASSERMRNLWARVLSGEIIKPGSFTRQTLRFLHDLDKQTADAFEEVAQNVLSDQVFADDDLNIPNFASMLHLGSVGALSGVGGLVSWNAPTDAAGRFYVVGKKYALIGAASTESKITLEATPLTQVGRELLNIVPNSDEKRTILALAEKLKTPHAFFKQTIKGTALAEVKDGKIQFVEVLWGESPFAPNSPDAVDKQTTSVADEQRQL
jgi:hypothetical protein